MEAKEFIAIAVIVVTVVMGLVSCGPTTHACKAYKQHNATGYVRSY